MASAVTDYVINRFKIRGIRDTTTPHAACPICLGDSSEFEPFGDSKDLYRFTCQRGHEFLQTRQAALAHAKFLARFISGQETHNR